MIRWGQYIRRNSGSFQRRLSLVSGTKWNTPQPAWHYNGSCEI